METQFLKKIFSDIRDEVPRNIWRKEESIDESKIKEEIQFLINSPSELDKLVSILFENKELTPDNVFTNIQEINAHLHFNDYSNELAGSVLLKILNDLTRLGSQSVLENLYDTSNRYIWNVLRLLPFVLSRYKIEPSFAANWFYKIGENVKQDLSSGNLFNAIDNYAYSFPEDAFKVFNIYLEQNFLGIQLPLSSVILGSIRAAVRDKKLSNSLIFIEEKLLNSSDENYRCVFFKSWISTYVREAATYDEVIEMVKKAMKGKEKEINEAFFILFRIVVKNINNNEIILKTINVIDSNITNNLPAEAKFQIFETLYWLITFDKNNQDINNRLHSYLSIFTKIMPVETEYLGIWKKIEEILTSLIEKQSSVFNEFLDVIIQRSFNSFWELLSQDHFENLEYTLSNSIAADVFTKLIFSEDEKDRLIAIELFRKLNDLSIKSNDIKPSEKVLSSLLLDFSKSVLLEKSGKFLIMIEPYFRNVREELKNEFVKEMVFQAVNFRGACFDVWSNIEIQSEIIKIVIDRAKTYYEKLKSVHNLPARNFIYYKFIEGAELERKIQSRDLNKKVKEKSVFLSLIKHTQILYGDRWAFQNNPGEEKARKFNELSYSIEFPRIENIDPEGMVLKRMYINASLKIK